MIAVRMSDHAYDNLCAKVAHPSVRSTSYEWSGEGIGAASVVSIPHSRYNTSNGISKYINAFCAQAHHPSTFTDDRPPRMKTLVPYTQITRHNWTECAAQATQAIASNATAPNATPPSIKLPQPPYFIDQYIDGPCSVLCTPYLFDLDQLDPTQYPMWTDSTEYRQRHLNLTTYSIKYLAWVGLWWRIPQLYKQWGYTRGGGPTLTSKAGAVLEAIGMDYLRHDTLATEDPKQKRKDYLAKWKATYPGPQNR